MTQLVNAAQYEGLNKKLDVFGIHPNLSSGEAETGSSLSLLVSQSRDPVSK